MSVLGFLLEEAVRHLEADGFRIKTSETRSRKGVDGNERRVVREQYAMDAGVNCAYLTYAAFQTKPVENIH